MWRVKNLARRQAVTPANALPVIQSRTTWRSYPSRSSQVLSELLLRCRHGDWDIGTCVHLSRRRHERLSGLIPLTIVAHLSRQAKSLHVDGHAKRGLLTL